MPHSEPPLPQMHQPLVALHVFDSASAALDVAREYGVHHFPVYNRELVVGMVCTCDLQEAVPERPVGDLMHPAVTIPAERSLGDAAQLMREQEVGSVLITDGDGAACGIVTRSDLSDEPLAAALLDDYRCEACGSIHHLRRRGDQRLCFSCRERAVEPQEFDTGGGD